MRARHFWLAAGGVLAAVVIGAWVAGYDLPRLAENAGSAVQRLVAQLATSDTQTVKGAGGPKSDAPPPPVTISQPLQRELAEWDEYTGRFDAVETVEVRARISGYLTEVHFKDGQAVQKGDLLYVIDPRPFERALALAVAEHDQAKVRISNATLAVERGRPLVERKVMSGQVFDDRENLLREAQAAEKVAEARVASARLDLEFTRITAPISGRISRSIVTAGNFVTGGGGSDGMTLTRIVSQHPIYVYFDVSENNAIKYKRLAHKGQSNGAGASIGTPIELAMPDETGFLHKGRLDFLDNRLDAGTGTLNARGLVDNASGFFAPGMFIRVRLQGSERYTATLLPDEAIGTDQASKFVYVVDEQGVPARKPVKLGPLSEGLRIVREGIGAEDWVIVKGLPRVRAGQKVAAKRDTIKISDMVDPGEVTPPVKR